MSILSQFKQSQNTDFPNVRPSLDLRFALAKKLDPRITFTRGSTGTYFGSDGIMRTAGVNEPRFDHDPITGQSLGLLIEESRTNLSTRSDIEGTVGSTPTGFQPAAGASSGQSVVVSTDISLGPNGQSAKHTRGTSSDNNMGYIFSSGLTVGQTYCASIWLYIPSSQAQNFSGKTINFQAEGNPAATNISIGSFNTNLVGVWQRAYCVFTANSTGYGVIPRTTAVAGSFFYTDCWQLEQGALPTSYIPTIASTVTRSVDNGVMRGTNLSSWYNQTEGTFFTDIKSSTSFISNINATPFGIFTAANSIVLSNYNNASSNWIFRNSTGSNNIFFSQTMLVSSNRKSIATYRTGPPDYYTAAFAGSNIKDSTTTSGSANPRTGTLRTDQSYLEINPNRSGLVPLNGTISRLTYYPIQLTPTQLINLTS